MADREERAYKLKFMTKDELQRTYGLSAAETEKQWVEGFRRFKTDDNGPNAELRIAFPEIQEHGEITEQRVTQQVVYIYMAD